MSAMNENTEAIEFQTYLANRKFHRSFYLYPDESKGRLKLMRITYADYGYRDQNSIDGRQRSETVILVCGPMIATRYLHIAKDAFAKEQKVRIIHPDRFGFGGTTEVTVNERVKAWLEIVPALLQHLGIKHVAVMAQSGGAIYALNLILYQPYVALGAPWIVPSHSGATAMRLMKIFPNAVFSNIDSFAQWFRSNIMPVTGFSDIIITNIGASMNALLKSKKTPGQPENDSKDENSFLFEEKLRPVAVDMAYAENVQGLSQEALLFLKRGNSHDWGPWEDYDRYVPLLVETQKEYMKSHPEMQKLKVDVFYAESDIMIGNSEGPKWFDDCWKEEIRGPHIEYSSRFVKGADHDEIYNLRWGAAHQVFKEARTRSTEF